MSLETESRSSVEQRHNQSAVNHSADRDMSDEVGSMRQQKYSMMISVCGQ
jgi:hypothetical protein